MATSFEHQQPLNDFGFCKSAPMAQHGGVYVRAARPRLGRPDAGEDAIACKPAGVVVAAPPLRHLLRVKPAPRPPSGPRRAAAPLEHGGA